jgi:hypothetical protein
MVPYLYAGLDPDPATEMNADQCGCVSERIRIRNLTGKKGNQLTAETKKDLRANGKSNGGRRKKVEGKSEKSRGKNKKVEGKR